VTKGRLGDSENNPVDPTLDMELHLATYQPWVRKDFFWPNLPPLYLLGHTLEASFPFKDDDRHFLFLQINIILKAFCFCN